MTRSPKEVLFGERMRKVARDVVERRRTVLLGEPGSDTSDTGLVGDASKSARARTSKGVSEGNESLSGTPKAVVRSKKSTAASARAREVDLLVQEIVRKMVDGTWVTGASHDELAAREGVTRNAVEQWSAEAARLLRIGADVEMYRGINLRRLDEAHARALAKQGFIAVPGAEPVSFPDPDVKTAIAAVAEQNRMLGTHAKQEVEITMKAKQLEELPPAELLSKVRMQRAKLDEIEAKLLAEHPELRRPEFVPSKKGKGA